MKPMKERRSRTGQASAKTAADVDALLMSSLELMEKICAYLMLFSIAAAFWNRFVPDAFPLKTPFLSLLEMTVGIRELSAMSGVYPLLKDACIVGAAAFGGLSGAAQTRTVIKNCRTVHPALYGMEMGASGPLQSDLYSSVVCSSAGSMMPDASSPRLEVTIS